MYAIVEIAGQQYKVEKDQQLFVHRLEGKEGSKVSFDNVLLTADGSNIVVGAPAVKDISISAKIIEHLKGDKVIVFKKKRRKGYAVKNGHRQYLSKIEIEAIGKSSSKSTTSKTAEQPKAEKAVESKPKATETKPKTANKEAAKSAVEKPKATAVKKEAPKAKTTSTKESADDLTQIKGIGPVHMKELNKAGFTSFQQIASLTAKDSQKIDEIDGISAEMVDSEDWKQQATDLNNFKKLLVNLGAAKVSEKNNLTEINGIGEALEKELNEVGVYTFEQVSKILVKDMEYLSALSGITRNKIETEEWVKQAKALLK